jgi:hypothetical protein
MLFQVRSGFTITSVSPNTTVADTPLGRVSSAFLTVPSSGVSASEALADMTDTKKIISAERDRPHIIFDP